MVQLCRPVSSTRFFCHSAFHPLNQTAESGPRIEISIRKGWETWYLWNYWDVVMIGFLDVNVRLDKTPRCSTFQQSLSCPTVAARKSQQPCSAIGDSGRRARTNRGKDSKSWTWKAKTVVRKIRTKLLYKMVPPKDWKHGFINLSTAVLPLGKQCGVRLAKLFAKKKDQRPEACVTGV